MMKSLPLTVMNDTRGMRACGQENMPIATDGEKVGDQVKVISVIQNEQPSCVVNQLLLDGCNDKVLILLVLLWQAQQPCERHEVGDERLGRSSPDPQDEAVLLTVAIGISHRDLRLANATQAADSLCQGPPFLCHKYLRQGSENILASRKEGIALVGNIPDGQTILLEESQLLGTLPIEGTELLPIIGSWRDLATLPPSYCLLIGSAYLLDHIFLWPATQFTLGSWLNQEGSVLVCQAGDAFPLLVEGFSRGLSQPS
jgi:hypothetical protein